MVSSLLKLRHQRGSSTRPWRVLSALHPLGKGSSSRVRLVNKSTPQTDFLNHLKACGLDPPLRARVNPKRPRPCIVSAPIQVGQRAYGLHLPSKPACLRLEYTTLKQRGQGDFDSYYHTKRVTLVGYTITKTFTWNYVCNNKELVGRDVARLSNGSMLMSITTNSR